ncbi:hypothetical protein MAR_036542 [Mya arenaria]|uniref:Uncharacterized protein n=1 Tax=Mya arenaria TaxID=6604 RepID=A0ABY7FL01_MYAAR|nr:hypothetical protein MAR_036542 [Mya arenaria]
MLPTLISSRLQRDANRLGDCIVVVNVDLKGNKYFYLLMVQERESPYLTISSQFPHPWSKKKPEYLHSTSPMDPDNIESSILRKHRVENKADIICQHFMPSRYITVHAIQYSLHCCTYTHGKRSCGDGHQLIPEPQITLDNPFITAFTIAAGTPGLTQIKKGQQVCAVHWADKPGEIKVSSCLSYTEQISQWKVQQLYSVNEQISQWEAKQLYPVNEQISHLATGCNAIS